MSQFVVYDSATPDVPIVFESPNPVSYATSSPSKYADVVGQLISPQAVGAASNVNATGGAANSGLVSYGSTNGSCQHRAQCRHFSSTSVQVCNHEGFAGTSTASSLVATARSGSDGSTSSMFNTFTGQTDVSDECNVARESAYDVADGRRSGGTGDERGEKRARKSNVTKFKDFVVEKVGRASRKHTDVPNINEVAVDGWRLRNCVVQDDCVLEGGREGRGEAENDDDHYQHKKDLELITASERCDRGYARRGRGRGRGRDCGLRCSRDGVLPGVGQNEFEAFSFEESVETVNRKPSTGVFRRQGRSRSASVRGRGQGRGSSGVGPARDRGRGRGRGRSRGTSGRSRQRGPPNGSSLSRSLITAEDLGQRRRRGRPRGSGRGSTLKRLGRKVLDQGQIMMATGRGQSVGRGRGRGRGIDTAQIQMRRPLHRGRGRDTRLLRLTYEGCEPRASFGSDCLELESTSENSSSIYENYTNAHEPNSTDLDGTSDMLSALDDGDSCDNDGTSSFSPKCRGQKLGSKKSTINRSDYQNRLEKIKQVLDLSRVKVHRKELSQTCSGISLMSETAVVVGNVDVGEVGKVSTSPSPNGGSSVKAQFEAQPAEKGPGEQTDVVEGEACVKKIRPLYDELMMRMKAQCGPDLRVTLTRLEVPAAYDEIYFCRLDLRRKEPHLSRVIVSHNKNERTVVPLRDVLYPSGDTGSWRDLARITKRPSEKPPPARKYPSPGAAPTETTRVFASGHINDEVSLPSSGLPATDLKREPSETGRLIVGDNSDVSENDYFLYLAEHEEQRLYERLLLDDWRIAKAIKGNPARFRRTRSDIEGQGANIETHTAVCDVVKRDSLLLDEQPQSSQVKPVAELPLAPLAERNYQIEAASREMEQLRQSLQEIMEDNRRMSNILTQQQRQQLDQERRHKQTTQTTVQRTLRLGNARGRSTDNELPQSIEQADDADAKSTASSQKSRQADTLDVTLSSPPRATNLRASLRRLCAISQSTDTRTTSEKLHRPKRRRDSETPPPELVNARTVRDTTRRSSLMAHNRMQRTTVDQVFSIDTKRGLQATDGDLKHSESSRENR